MPLPIIRWTDIRGRPPWISDASPVSAADRAFLDRIEALSGSGYLFRNANGSISLQSSSDGGGSIDVDGRGFITVTSNGLRVRDISVADSFLRVTNPKGEAGNPSIGFRSQAANAFLAAPDGAAGSPVFRSMVIDDVPDLSSLYDVAGAAAAAEAAANAYTDVEVATALALALAYTDSEIAALSTVYQPLDSILTELAGLADASGVLTNDGFGTLSWEAGGGGTGYNIGAAIASNADQSITHATITTKIWQVERFDNGNCADLGTNNDRLTVPAGQGGTYIIGYTLCWAPNASGGRQSWIGLNGNFAVLRYAEMSILPRTDGGVTTTSSSTVVALAAGDFIGLAVYQNSGGNLNVYQDAVTQSSLWMRRV